MTTDKIKIPMSDRSPVMIDPEEWPIIASAEAHDGQVQCQANTEWTIFVRQNEDGRRIVYGSSERGDGGKPAGWRGAHAGYLLGDYNTPISNARSVGEEETVRAIRRVGGVIGRSDLADDCIADLPAVDI